MKKAPAIVPILVGAALLATSPAAAARREFFNGCVQEDPRTGCLTVQSGRMLYDINNVRRRPLANRWIEGHGERGVRARGTCREGVQLDVGSWIYVGQPCSAIPDWRRRSR